MLPRMPFNNPVLQLRRWFAQLKKRCELREGDAVMCVTVAQVTQKSSKKVSYFALPMTKVPAVAALHSGH